MTIINLKKAVAIGAGSLVIVVAIAVGWPARSPPQPPAPRPQTLCQYLRSTANAACTVAVAPDKLPVGGVLTLADSRDQTTPLPLVSRDFASACWLKPEDQIDTRQALRQPPADIALPGFTADIGRSLKAGETLSLVESDSLSLRAGSHADLVQKISVELRNPQVLRLNQAEIEKLLHRPEVRADCFSRLLGSKTRLVTSVIYANGIDYTIVTTDNHRLSLDAAVKSGYINLPAGEPKLSKTDPVIIGAVVADDSLLSKLKSFVMQGDVIDASGINHIDSSVFGAGELRGAQAPVSQAANGSLEIDAVTLKNAIASNLARGKPPVSSSISLTLPNINGSATANSSNSEPGSPSPIATVNLNTDIQYIDPLVRGEVRSRAGSSPGRPGPVARRVQEFLAVSLSQKATADFDVFKRSDGPDLLTVTLRANRMTPDTSQIGDKVTIVITDSVGRPVGREDKVALRSIGPDGHVTTTPVSEAGIYHVSITQQGDVPSSVHLTVQTDLAITTSLGPRASVDLAAQPAPMPNSK